MIHKAYRFRLYPNQEQRVKIDKTLGAVRYVYNYFLYEWNQAYHESGHGLNFAYCSAQLPKMKKEKQTKWLKEVDSLALQAAVQQLSDAFIYFYKYQSRFPKPKTKNDYYQRFVSKQVKNNIVVKDHHVRIPKIGWVKIKQSQDIRGYITNITVTKEATGRYFVSVMTRFEGQDLPECDKVVAIVPTSDGSILTSDGRYYRNHFVTASWLQRLEKEEARQENLKKQALANKKPLSEAKNYQKQVKKVARMYEKLENNRKDFLHKLSTELVEHYGVICVPKYYRRDKIANAFLDKKSDMSWDELIHQLNYKCQWAGRLFYMADIEKREQNLSDKKLVESLSMRAAEYADTVKQYK